MTGYQSKKKAAQDKLAQPAQEPVAVYQFRSPQCADWYDGIPDHHDGHGPYEVRTLYTAPPQRTWVGLTDEEFSDCLVEGDPCEALAEPEAWAVMREVAAKLKEKNT